MSTINQKRANRLNAKKSTGPKTEAGKEKSRFNALVHGLRAESTLLLRSATHRSMSLSFLAPSQTIESDGSRLWRAHSCAPRRDSSRRLAAAFRAIPDVRTLETQ